MRRFTTIRISWLNGTLAVPAELIGDYLAIHREFMATEPPKPSRLKRYVITHIPTGHAVFSGTGKVFVRKIAKALADLPWQTIKTPKNKKAIEALRERRREILKTFGVQV